MDKQISSVANLIDMSRDDFVSYVKSIPNMTELFGTKNILATEYARVEAVKNEILSRLKVEKNELQKAKLQKSLDDLYTVLSVIEDRCAVVEEEKKLRSKSS